MDIYKIMDVCGLWIDIFIKPHQTRYLESSMDDIYNKIYSLCISNHIIPVSGFHWIALQLHPVTPGDPHANDLGTEQVERCCRTTWAADVTTVLKLDIQLDYIKKILTLQRHH